MAATPSIHSIDDLEAQAVARLPKMVRDYFNGGAMDSVTLAANRKAFGDYYILPRALRDVSSIDMSAKVFNNTLPFPCSVAPAAMQKMAHPDGEIATARACGRAGVVMGLSSFSTTSLEEVKAAADEARREAGLEGESECVLQMYLFENRSVSEGLIRRAEAVGYRAIVLTVDTPFFGRRLSEARNQFRVPPHLRMANFDAGEGVKTGSELRTDDSAAKAKGAKATSTANKNGRSCGHTMDCRGAPSDLQLDASLTWDVIPYLKSITKLPIWLKGIMTEEDALAGVEHGADAIFVSNHGGRQLDGAPPTLDVLPGIVKAVNGRIPVVSGLGSTSPSTNSGTDRDSISMVASGGAPTSSKHCAWARTWSGSEGRHCGGLPWTGREGVPRR